MDAVDLVFGRRLSAQDIPVLADELATSRSLLRTLDAIPGADSAAVRAWLDALTMRMLSLEERLVS